MLVLTRKAGESLVLDDRIIVTVVEIKGGKVRIAIEAPGEVPIHRKEVYERICASRHAETPPRDGCLC